MVVEVADAEAGCNLLLDAPELEAAAGFPPDGIIQGLRIPGV